MQKLLSIFFSILIFSTGLMGQHSSAYLDEATALKRAAKNEIAQLSSPKDYSCINTIESQSSPARIYVLSDHEGGSFIITHNLKSYPAMLGYGDQSAPPERGIPEQLQALLKTRLLELEKIGESSHEYPVHQPKSQLSQVTPLISSSWDQTCYYNDSCPADPAAPPNLCGHVWVGCVATTMGQIMKYYEHPAQGSGTHSYYSIQYGNLSADFGSTTYDWSSMPDVLNQASPEVARLLSHCGISVEMNYNLLGSGSLTSVAGIAFKLFFGYDPGLALHYASAYSATAWDNLLQQELDSARPFIYRSEQAGGGAGHAWVIDGYDNSGLYHCNWGWGGYYNGFFNLNSLTPNLNNFNQQHGALIGIKPIGQTLKAQFTVQDNIAGINEGIDFTDLSLGNAVSWQWEFPGASISSSSIQHPQGVTYPNPGKYGVTLIVSDGNSHDTIVKTDYITITPFPEWSADNPVIEAGNEVQFINRSITKYPILSVQWSFPGGSPASSNLLNPAPVTYGQAGQYDVSLSITTAAGTHSITKQGMIKAYTDCDTLFLHDGKDYEVHPTVSSGFTYLPQDLDQLTPYFAGPPYNHTSGWNTFNDGNINPTDTNYFLGAASLFTPPGQANNWLSFGPFPVGPEGLQFSWKHYSFSNDQRDGYEVLHSTTGSGSTNFTDPPLLVFGDNDPATDGDTIWETQNLDITQSMAGPQGVYLAFHHFANNQFYLFLDDIRITACTGLPVSLEDTEYKHYPEVFPNPADDIIYLRWKDARFDQLELRDVSGRLILRKDIKHRKNIKLNIEELEPGLYFLNFVGDEVQTRKVLIK